MLYRLQLTDSPAPSDAVILGDGVYSYIPLLQLTGGGGGLSVPGGINWSEPLAQASGDQPAHTRAVKLGQLFTGPTVNNTQVGWHLVEQKLNQARAAWGEQGRGPKVVWWYQPEGITDPTLWEVAGGKLEYAYLGDPEGIPWYGALLTLYVAKDGRGPIVILAAQPTATNGSSACVFLQQRVPGNAPAFVHTEIKDASIGLTIVRLTLARRSYYGSMSAGDFSGIYGLTAVSPGVATTDAGANYIGGSFSRVTTSQSWQDIGKTVRPAGNFQDGRFFVKLRLRESSVALTMPYGATATPSGTGGALPPGSYTGFLTTRDGSGNESLPMGLPSVTVPITNAGFFDGFEGQDFSLWSPEVFYTTGNPGTPTNTNTRNQQASMTIEADAAYTLDSVSSFGCRVNAANNAGIARFHAVPNGGNSASARMRLNIKTNTGTAGTGVYNEIPMLVQNDGTRILSLFDVGSGWVIGTSSAATVNVHLPEGSPIVFGWVAVWNGSTSYTVSVYVDDTAVVSNQVINSTFAPANIAIGGKSVGSGWQLELDIDNVQLGQSWIGANAGSIAYTWQPGLNGTGYYLYLERNAAPYVRIPLTGISTTSYTLTSTAPVGSTANTPPPSTAPAIANALFRVGVALDGTALTNLNFTWARPKPSVVANGLWEEILLGPLLPPRVPFQSGAAVPNWQIRVQVKSGSTNSSTADVNYLTLLPAEDDEDICTIAVPGYTLPQQGQFRVDSRYDGLTQCDVVAASDGVTPLCTAVVSGCWTYVPGDTYVVMGVEVAGPVNGLPISDVLNAKAVYGQGGVLVAPRYTHRVGQQ